MLGFRFTVNTAIGLCLWAVAKFMPESIVLLCSTSTNVVVKSSRSLSHLLMSFLCISCCRTNTMNTDDFSCVIAVFRVLCVYSSGWYHWTEASSENPGSSGGSDERGARVQRRTSGPGQHRSSERRERDGGPEGMSTITLPFYEATVRWLCRHSLLVAFFDLHNLSVNWLNKIVDVVFYWPYRFRTFYTHMKNWHKAVLSNSTQTIF